MAVAISLVLVTGAPARAVNGGVVEGTIFSGDRPGTTFTLDFTLIGTVSMGGVAHAGSFTLSGQTGGYDYHSPPPYPITGSLAFSGTTPLGDPIAGTCSEPGSTMSFRPSVAGGPNFSMALRCSGAVGGGPSQPFTLAISTVAAWVQSPLTSDIIGRAHGVFG